MIPITGAPSTSQAQADPTESISAGFAAGAPGLPDGSAIRTHPSYEHPVPSRPQTSAPKPATAAPGVAPSHQHPDDGTGWTDVEVLAAQAHCRLVLSGLNAKFTFLPQLRNGACGAPAPIELESFGRGTKITVAPPAIVNCDAAAAMIRWTNEQVLPMAQRQLRTTITQINTMSSYSCRNRYGAKQAPLSQHALAKAIDVRGFVTARGELIDVELHWGPTQKEVLRFEATRQSALAQQAVEDLASQQTGGFKSTFPVVPEPQAGYRTQVVAANARSALTRVTFTAKDPGIKIVATGATAALGAPQVQPGQPLDARATFLRNIHGGACGLFGTVLGPEANNAHRNHFHIDMAERRLGAYCQ